MREALHVIKMNAATTPREHWEDETLLHTPFVPSSRINRRLSSCVAALLLEIAVIEGSNLCIQLISCDYFRRNLHAGLLTHACFVCVCKLCAEWQRQDDYLSHTPPLGLVLR